MSFTAHVLCSLSLVKLKTEKKQTIREPHRKVTKPKSKFLLILLGFEQPDPDDNSISWSAEDKENAEGVESLDTSNTSALAGMAETIAICWGGIKDQLDKVRFMTLYMSG